MKKILLSTPYEWIADDFISEKQETLKDGEYLTSERRFYNDHTQWIVYITTKNK